MIWVDVRLMSGNVRIMSDAGMPIWCGFQVIAGRFGRFGHYFEVVVWSVLDSICFLIWWVIPGKQPPSISFLVWGTVAVHCQPHRLQVGLIRLTAQPPSKPPCGQFLNPWVIG